MNKNDNNKSKIVSKKKSKCKQAKNKKKIKEMVKKKKGTDTTNDKKKSERIRMKVHNEKKIFYKENTALNTVRKWTIYCFFVVCFYVFYHFFFLPSY